MDPIRAGIQQILDESGDGWTAHHYIACVGIERVTADGDLESTSWYVTPGTQADYITDGLLTAIEEARAHMEVE